MRMRTGARRLTPVRLQPVSSEASACVPTHLLATPCQGTSLCVLPTLCRLLLMSMLMC